MPANAGFHRDIYCGPIDCLRSLNVADLSVVVLLVKTGPEKFSRVSLCIYENDPQKAAEKARAQGRKFYGERFAGIAP